MIGDDDRDGFGEGWRPMPCRIQHPGTLAPSDSLYVEPR